MRAVRDDRIEEFEDAAMEALKHIRAFFKYEGTNQTYVQKAKVANGVIGAYARLRASETNRMAVELQAGRTLDLPSRPVKALPRKAG